MSTVFLRGRAFEEEFFEAWRSFHPMLIGTGSGLERPLPVLIGSDESRPVIPRRVGLHQSPPPLHRLVSVLLKRTPVAQLRGRAQVRSSLAELPEPLH